MFSARAVVADSRISQHCVDIYFLFVMSVMGICFNFFLETIRFGLNNNETCALLEIFCFGSISSSAEFGELGVCVVFSV